MKSLEELFPTLGISWQQLREKCEANITESKKVVEYSRKLIEQSHVILKKSERMKKP